MLYSPLTVPVRSTVTDNQGLLTRVWLDWLGGVARKAGRSALWRGEYSKDLQYDVCDMVRQGEKLFIALQGNPVNGKAVTPGDDDKVWQLVIDATKGEGSGLPPGGAEGQVLAKASAADFDVHWVNQQGGPHGGYYAPLTDGNYNFIFGGDGDVVMVWVPGS